MDSPNASGYVPLSLVDTLSKPHRSYRSVHATPSSSSSSAGGGGATTLSTSRSYHHAHSASLAALASKERSEQARREAAAISETLGLGVASETPVPTRRTISSGGGANRRRQDATDEEHDVEATPKPTKGGGESAVEVAALRAKVGDRDDEIAQLRRELAAATRDKHDLVNKCRRLEADAQLERQQTATGARGGGLDATQVEELVKQFSDQEALLGGYQREAEKSLAELDRLRTKERRFNDWFEKMYGPGWAEELNLTDKPSLSSSPALRTKLSSHAARPSLVPSHSSASTGELFRARQDSASTGPRDATTSRPPSSLSSSDSQHPSPPSPSTATTTTATTTTPAAVTMDPTLSPLALRHHLESVQALIRGMETRLVARGVELAQVEKRARTDAKAADAKRVELEQFVTASSRPPSVAVRSSS
ncbi:hypothetical protein JCM3766R1_000115 [Sporobolomyces carnicolor]